MVLQRIAILVCIITLNFNSTSAQPLWTKDRPTPLNGLSNPYELPPSQLHEYVRQGRLHGLNYPVDVTGILIPYHPMKRALAAEGAVLDGHVDDVAGHLRPDGEGLADEARVPEHEVRAGPVEAAPGRVHITNRTDIAAQRAVTGATAAARLRMRVIVAVRMRVFLWLSVMRHGCLRLRIINRSRR